MTAAVRFLFGLICDLFYYFWPAAGTVVFLALLVRALSLGADLADRISR